MSMQDMGREVERLREMTQRTRLDFLKAELQTCFTALEMGKIELSAGNVPVAEKELAFLEKGVQTIERFLPELPEPQRDSIHTSLARLKAAIDPFRANLRR
jgi:hypothetical protein